MHVDVRSRLPTGEFNPVRVGQRQCGDLVGDLFVRDDVEVEGAHVAFAVALRIRGVPADLQAPPDRDQRGGAEIQLDGLIRAQRRKSLEQHLQPGGALHPGERVAQAGVPPGGKPQVIGGVGAVDVEIERPVAVRGIGVRAAQRHVDHLTGGDGHPADLDVGGGAAGGERRGRPAAHGFLEHPRPELGFGQHVLQGFTVAGQVEDRVGHGLCGGVGTGGGEFGDVQPDPRGVQGPGAIGFAGGGRHRDEVVGRGAAPGFDDLAQFEVGRHEPVPDLAPGVLGDVLVRAGEHDEQVVAHLPQHGFPGGVQVEQRHDRLRGQLQTVILDEVAGSVVLEPVHDAVGAGLDLGLQPVHAVLDEPALGDPAGFGVLRRVLADDHAGDEFGWEHLVVLVRDLGRGVGRGGERLPVTEHAQRVLAPGDHPAVQPLVPEHRASSRAAARCRAGSR